MDRAHRILVVEILLDVVCIGSVIGLRLSTVCSSRISNLDLETPFQCHQSTDYSLYKD